MRTYGSGRVIRFPRDDCTVALRNIFGIFFERRHTLRPTCVLYIRVYTYYTTIRILNINTREPEKIYNNATIKTRDSGKISFLLGGITQKYDAPPLYYYYTFDRCDAKRP